ncbi:hypothetical protein [Actinocatenispora sera]|uniref:hypothetical protein n=1 Tax=Actinocatenispora sera TaxID=390989 RepID=UPI0012EE7152|nr:hypothetical protein [Actinocatenispora sera]
MLSRELGPDWVAKCGVSEEKVSRWEERRDEEPKRRPGGEVDRRLLWYSEFHDLYTLINKSWQLGFKECFQDKKRLEVYLDRIGAFRNPDAHSRDLLPFEESLVVGMSGELRQQITLYLSKGAGGLEREHFPRIEYLRDNFGNEGGDALSIETGLTLRAGDTLHFTGRAWDPDGDIPTWEVFVNGRGAVFTSEGSEFEWDFAIGTSHINVRASVLIFLKSPKTYHKHNSFDEATTFYYSILPPS